MNRRRLILSVSLLTLVVAGVALPYTLKDVTPPEISVTAPSEVPAELPFEVVLSADEAVTFQVVYGDLELSKQAQTYNLSLLAEAGANTVEVVATDAADNESETAFSVLGIPQVDPVVSLPEDRIPGEPISVVATWSSEGAQPVSVAIAVAGEPQPVVVLENQSVALAGIPLGTEPGLLPVTVTTTDEYERTVTKTFELAVLEYPQAVEELNLSGSTLSVITPEGREQERQMIAAAYTRLGEQPQPAWTDTFVLPIEGEGTSGFGSPRRYAAGGNVSYHNGADIGAPTGTPILATNAGRVLVADFYPIKGGFTLIDHGAGLYSYYLHQSAIEVEPEQLVERGQQIGQVGSTGLSTGPHLHWEMRLNGVPTNPLSWVGKVKP